VPASAWRALMVPTIDPGLGRCVPHAHFCRASI
jgi:hypothetical protein